MRYISLCLLLLLASCRSATPPEYLNMSIQPRNEVASSQNVRIFYHDDQSGKFITSLSATSCQLVNGGTPPSKGDAIQQLKLKAHRAGANGIKNVNFTEFATQDFGGADCRSYVHATGDAVKLKQ